MEIGCQYKFIQLKLEPLYNYYLNHLKFEIFIISNSKFMIIVALKLFPIESKDILSVKQSLTAKMELFFVEMKL